MSTCPVCKTLVNSLLSGGSDQYTVRIDLKRPVVGIGAPIHFFLPRAPKALGTEAVLPENANVANAIGAINSNVVVKRQLRIIPDEEGGFLIEGWPARDTLKNSTMPMPLRGRNWFTK